MFCQTIEELRKDELPLVFIDERGFAHDMPRTHGYSSKGQKCYGLQDWGAKGRTNVIGALCKGVRGAMEQATDLRVIWIS